MELLSGGESWPIGSVSCTYRTAQKYLAFEAARRGFSGVQISLSSPGAADPKQIQNSPDLSYSTYSILSWLRLSRSRS